MSLATFKLERWFAQYEFTAQHLLCSSDMQSMSIGDLLSLSDPSNPDFSDLGSLNDVWLGYTDTRGSPALRNEIVKLHHGKIAADQVLVHAGAEEAIYNFSKAVLGPDDHAIVIFPSYQSLHECPRSTGCSVSYWKLKEAADGSWTLSVDELRAELEAHPNTKAVFINSPHNPTGYLMDKATRKGLLDLCSPKNILIFSDEVYSNMEHDRVERSVSVCEEYEHGISLNVMSKSFGLAGLRIGWVATRNSAVLAAMASYKDYVSICSSAPSEYLATVALRKRDEILKRNMAIIRKNLELLDAFFLKHQGKFLWKRPQAGCIAFPKILLPGVSSQQFADTLVLQKGVLLLPSTMYDYGDSHFRLGFGRANMAQGLALLDEYLNTM